MSRIMVLIQVSVIAVCFLIGSTTGPWAKGYSSLVQVDFAQRYPVTALDYALPEILEEGDIPGLSIAVIEDGEVAYVAGHGVKDTQTKEAVDENTIFSAASLSKPVFAYAVMRMVDRGELDLDQPLAEILPNPRLDHDPLYLQITARMVLSHTSGMPNWAAGDIMLECKPGERFNYSGEGICYLQKVVEHLTGKSLNQIMDREVFKPLGMKNSSYYWKDAFEGRAVSGHGLLGPHDTLREFTIDKQNAAYSLLTTSGDYAKFILAVASGKGLSKEIHEEMLTPQVEVIRDRSGPPFDNVYWGLGWGLQKGLAGNAFWHWGNNGIYMSYVVYYPEMGKGLVYFANSENGLSIARELVTRIVPDDHMALKMLNVQEYDAPGRDEEILKRQAYINGDIKAGEGIYYYGKLEKPNDTLDVGILNWIYDRFFT